ncbi:endoplasmic reticulum metallopeptidase 1-like isoform X2 [Condylostylus longicornis]|uniref:endoplasmic reticulum metallopeptidase 1-like isoform X2 n=1 Tax=Condylostylus longicornis TaxID=2530218 RepID=UPI00244DBAF3|nr:endoplasmic reticulum metallopeptidase 1-like isoform X2 [Condylostylus longicornis]
MEFTKGSSSTFAPKYKTLKITYSKNKLNFFWSGLYFTLWGFLIFLVWWHLKNILPKPYSINNETSLQNEFIAERAERRLQDLVRIGPRVVGSANNEQATVKLLLDAIEKIKISASNKFKIEVNKQLGNGSFYIFGFVNIYRNIQNIIVKLTPVNSTSTSALLINSHFDSRPGSPGAGDDGTMVVVMLEILRVLIHSQELLKHPIIFLFNGAEETGLQASHAFITQHVWAKDVKAFINLDSAGNGGREILFQSGPAAPWLIKHYGNVAKHPFASTIAEEMFQNGLIPSDTDFRIFRDFGNIPGLDFAHSQNGYVYHTAYDKISSIPRGTLQNTGDNILAIVMAITNSNELKDPTIEHPSQAIFYDVLGLFLINYTETEAFIINFCVSAIAIVTIILSFCLMKKSSGLFCRRILTRFIIILLIQVASVLIAFGLGIGVAFFLDIIGCSMAWYSQSWLILGLYFCTIFFGLSLVPLIYIKLTEENEFFPLNYKIQMFMHSHCLLQVIFLLILTAVKIHSGFLVMLSILFYTIAVILNVITTLQGKSLSWIVFPVLSQILPFMFYTYLVIIILTTFIPMTGRSFSNSNPELLISAISFVFAFLIGGFLIPLLFVFRKSEILVSIFAITSVIFIICTITPIGFPYTKSSFQRFDVIHTTRIFRDRNNKIMTNESGYLIQSLDRRGTRTIKDTVLNMTFVETADKLCDSHINCGSPNYPKKDDLWIPANPPLLIRVPLLKTKSRKLVKSEYENATRIRYEYSLTGPDHMKLFIKTLPLLRY